ncbi:EF-hand [Ramicandelaber brevisporus]|nr:EF-hand [Ramicandelaber brevisporus]
MNDQGGHRAGAHASYNDGRQRGLPTGQVRSDPQHHLQHQQHTQAHPPPLPPHQQQQHNVRQPRVLTEEEKNEIGEAFELFDTDHDGILHYYEFRVALRALGFDTSKQDALKTLQKYDYNRHTGGVGGAIGGTAATAANGNATSPGGGRLGPHNLGINRQDFEDLLIKWIAARDPMDEIKKAFKLFDEENKGKISLRNLQRVAKELGETIDDTELKAMIEEFDMNNDGEIDYEEFEAIMTGLF